MTHHSDTLILGGGPAGLAVALGMGKEALLLESAAEVGGLSATITLDGAVFDLGGHSFHTPHPHVRDLVFDALEMFEQTRDARCFHGGEWVPFPFQQHFEGLSDSALVAECRAGLADAGRTEGAADFQDFIDQSFGPGLSRHFMTPYNQKLWGRDLRRLEASWTRERVPTHKSAHDASQGRDGTRRPLQPKTSVAYPAQGGFGEIFLALGRRVASARTHTRITAIDPIKKRARASDGTEFGYERLVSTLALPDLLAIIDGTPPELVSAVARLEATSLHLVLVVINHPVDTPIQRIYSAEHDVAGHKIALNHNSSDTLRALPVHGVAAEISDLMSEGKGPKELERQVVADLIRMGILRSADEVVTTATRKFNRAYPVPTHDRPATIAAAKAWLEDHDIHTLGRFGEWAYINSDEALHRGMQLAHALMR